MLLSDRLEAALRAVTVWPPELAPGERFVPVPELVASGLAERICDRLGGAPLRTGQSAVVMGVASRLWSLTVVPAVTHGVLLEPAALCASDEDGAVVLGARELRALPVTSSEEVRAVVHAVLDPVVASFDLAPRLLWGNVAASLYAVPRVYGLSEARGLVADLLAEPPLAGELDELPGPPPGRARRRTCCLFYLAPGAGLCGDCVLDAVP